MKKYNVEITQTVPMVFNTTIEAESEEQAIELARESFYNDEFIDDFEPVDNWEVVHNDGLSFNVKEIK